VALNWFPRGAVRRPRIGSLEVPLGGLELIHSVVGSACFQSSFASKVFFVIIANVRTSHVLVLYACDALADFFALNIFDITKHRLIAEIFLGQIVRASRLPCGKLAA